MINAFQIISGKLILSLFTLESKRFPCCYQFTYHFDALY